MKNKPDPNMKDIFFAFMDGMNDCFEELSDGAYSEAMQNAIDGENGWNEQNNDFLDAYEAFMYWINKTWDKED
jgi:hypothetical protein